jgi:hypothetical protein
MPTVTLRPGERIRVELHEADGAFEIEYGEQELTVKADLPGSHLGGEGLIYREVFAGCTCGVSFADGAWDEKCPEHGLLSIAAQD